MHKTHVLAGSHPQGVGTVENGKTLIWVWEQGSPAGRGYLCLAVAICSGRGYLFLFAKNV